MSTLSKFFFEDEKPSMKNQHSTDTIFQPKICIKKFRMQEEFGPKKFIKP
jgi:hypothetical protein